MYTVVRLVCNSYRRSVVLLMVKLIEISNDIPILSASSKDSYDSDEILISNLKIFAGDIASRYTNLNAEDGGSVISSADTDECHIDPVHIPGEDAASKSISLKALDQIALDDVWRGQDNTIKG